MKYYQRPDVTVEFWPPSPQHGLSCHLPSSGKAVVGTPTPATTTMASMLAALARISHPHRRCIQTGATFRSLQEGIIG